MDNLLINITLIVITIIIILIIIYLINEYSVYKNDLEKSMTDKNKIIHNIYDKLSSNVSNNSNIINNLYQEDLNILNTQFNNTSNIITTIEKIYLNNEKNSSNISNNINSLEKINKNNYLLLDNSFDNINTSNNYLLNDIEKGNTNLKRFDDNLKHFFNFKENSQEINGPLYNKNMDNTINKELEFKDNTIFNKGLTVKTNDNKFVKICNNNDCMKLNVENKKFNFIPDDNIKNISIKGLNDKNLLNFDIQGNNIYVGGDNETNSPFFIKNDITQIKNLHADNIITNNIESIDGKYDIITYPKGTYDGLSKNKLSNIVPISSINNKVNDVPIDNSTYTQFENKVNNFKNIKKEICNVYDNGNNITYYEEGYHAFTSTTGKNSITFPEDTLCDILIVGGGGSGGNGIGGGGGAGGIVYIKNKTLTTGTYDITVGLGGAPITALLVDGGDGLQGNNGSNSSISSEGKVIKHNGFNCTGIGGGGGGSYFKHGENGLNGGSGGGGGEANNSSRGAGSTIQGNTFWNGSSFIGGGKNGRPSDPGGGYRCGGGGGMGTDPINNYDGQNGITLDITGTEVIYCAGGGGTNHSGTYEKGKGVGGKGGSNGVGGNSGHNNNDGTFIISTKPLENTGSGGGAGCYTNGYHQSSKGANGIVIIKFKSTIQNITRGLLAWYKFDDSDLTIDSSGLGNKLTNNGCIQNTSDYAKGTGSLQFTGNSFMTVSPPSTNYWNRNVFSVAFWYNYPNATNKWNTIISSRDLYPRAGWAINITTNFENSGNNNLEFWSLTGSTHSKYQTGIKIINKWVHIVFTYNNGRVQCFKDGILHGTSSVTVSAIESANLRIGAQDSVNQFRPPQNSKLDDVRIYDRVLTSQEISDIYNNKKLTGPLTKFPKNPMTNNNNIKQSSYYHNSFPAYLFFNHNVKDGVGGHFGGDYSGGNAKRTAISQFNYPGEYLMVNMDTSFVLKQVKFYIRNGFAGRAPGKFRIYGTNDINNFTTPSFTSGWDLIHEQTERLTGYSFGNEKKVDINNENSYSIYVLVISQLSGNDSYLNFNEWELYGY